MEGYKLELITPIVLVLECTNLQDHITRAAVQHVPLYTCPLASAQDPLVVKERDALKVEVEALSERLKKQGEQVTAAMRERTEGNEQVRHGCLIERERHVVRMSVDLRPLI